MMNEVYVNPDPDVNDMLRKEFGCRPAQSDLISRQAAISLPVKPKEDRYFQTHNLDDAYDYGWYDLQGCIKKMPSAQPDLSGYSDRLWKAAYERGKAEVERKTGKWIDDCTCSACHWIHENSDGFALLTNYNFCPNCGADMRGEEDECRCDS